MHNSQMPNQYALKNFVPLIIIFSIIISISLFKSWWQADNGWDLYDTMYDFMGTFFIIFGLFKVINLTKFVEAYQEYDLIAKAVPIYGYIYPFIELGLGTCYFFRYQIGVANWITVIIMAISALGVFQALRQGRSIVCACLGAVFKIPMTYVTLIEDLLMGLMALLMAIARLRLG